MVQNRWRYVTAQIVLLALLVALVWRVVYLQVLQKDFLISEGSSRWQRVEVISAPRGMLTDRNGEPLAVSTPVISIWADPREINLDDIPTLAKAVGVPAKVLKTRATQHKAFMYVKRHMTPDAANRIIELNIPGVYGQSEYKRYYPAGEVVSHVVGFTDIDDQGQEGVELAFNAHLQAESGKKQVVRDLLGRSVRDVGEITAAQPGKNLSLTVDVRLQYLAYRELKQAIASFGAKSGSVVVMDVETGEILALVNQPGYNPNDRSSLNPVALRNRAVTDLVEPGSVMKPITMAIALEAGLLNKNTKINTSPGYMKLGRFSIRDFRNYGTLTATEVIQKSSNVGIARLSADIPKQQFWQTLYDFGLGDAIGLGYPGEATGSIPNPLNWDKVTQGALSYGYGMAITPLHIAQAFATLANDGERVYAKLIKDSPTPDYALQVVSPSTARTVIDMMKTVVEPGGTARRANLDWYSVAGKTGTSHKVGAAGYEDSKYLSSFVGVAPADNPKIVTVVVINEPPEDKYYGGEVAAPIFKGFMQQALPLLGIEPDKSPLLAKGGQ